MNFSLEHVTELCNSCCKNQLFINKIYNIFVKTFESTYINKICFVKRNKLFVSKKILMLSFTKVRSDFDILNVTEISCNQIQCFSPYFLVGSNSIKLFDNYISKKFNSKKLFRSFISWNVHKIFLSYLAF
jgi:hypothetical protein